MNIQYLKYFVTLGECLNFSEAAKKLFITQPNLSYIINHLERQLGTKLFERSTKSVKLTQTGEILMPVAVEIIEKYDSVITQLAELSSTNRESLKVGYIGTPFNQLFSHCIPVFHDKYPTARITLQRFDPNYFLDAFNNDLIDIGFCHRIDAEFIGGLHYEKLFDVYLTVAVHADSPLSKLDCADLITFKNEPLIISSENFSPSLYKKVMEICKRRDFIPQISQRTQSIDGYFQMIDAKMGIAILPESCKYLNYPNIKFIKLCDNYDLNLEAGYAWRHKLKPLTLKLLEIVNDFVSDTMR